MRDRSWIKMMHFSCLKARKRKVSKTATATNLWNGPDWRPQCGAGRHWHPRWCPQPFRRKWCPPWRWSTCRCQTFCPCNQKFSQFFDAQLYSKLSAFPSLSQWGKRLQKCLIKGDNCAWLSGVNLGPSKEKKRQNSKLDLFETFLDTVLILS